MTLSDFRKFTAPFPGDTPLLKPIHANQQWWSLKHQNSGVRAVEISKIHTAYGAVIPNTLKRQTVVVIE